MMCLTLNKVLESQKTRFELAVEIQLSYKTIVVCFYIERQVEQRPAAKGKNLWRDSTALTKSGGVRLLLRTPHGHNIYKRWRQFERVSTKIVT